MVPAHVDLLEGLFRLGFNSSTLPAKGNRGRLLAMSCVLFFCSVRESRWMDHTQASFETSEFFSRGERHVVDQCRAKTMNAASWWSWRLQVKRWQLRMTSHQATDFNWWRRSCLVLSLCCGPSLFVSSPVSTRKRAKMGDEGSGIEKYEVSPRVTREQFSCSSGMTSGLVLQVGWK